MEQVIQRIVEMEQCLDLLSDADPARIPIEPALQQALAQLKAYYEGGQWLRDYELDEQGLLPRELKRGVLAQDTLFDLLADFDSQKEPEQWI